MSNVHGYKAVGFLNSGYVELPKKEPDRTEMLAWCEKKGLAVLYVSMAPKGCPATLAGGHVGGGLRCERGCRTLHACAARREQPERQPEYPTGHFLRPWAEGWNAGVDHAVGKLLGEPASKSYACNMQLCAVGKPHPRTCQQCGLGPCHNRVNYPESKT